MAVTSTGKVNNKEQQQQTQTQYNGLKGVTQNTATNLKNYQNGYNQSERVTNAQNTMQQVQAQKPQTYSSKYTEQLDNIMAQIQNPKEFKFSFDGDALFNAYKDQYVQQGQQASMDAMGQAAGLTGGYGNSYAQQVGNQAYQQYLLGLNDKAMDIYDRAYGRYRDDQAALNDQYNMIAAADDRDYGRYNDDYSKWLAERDFAANQAAAAEEMDYNRYLNDRSYWQQLAAAENQDYWTDTNFNEDVRRNNRDYAESVRQYNQNFAEDQRQYDADLNEKIRQFDASLEWDKMSQEQKYAAEYAMQIIANGQIPSEELLKAAGLSAADAQKMLVQVAAVGGGGGGGGGGNGGDKGDKSGTWTLNDHNEKNKDKKIQERVSEEAKNAVGTINVTPVMPSAMQTTKTPTVNAAKTAAATNLVVQRNKNKLDRVR